MLILTAQMCCALQGFVALGFPQLPALMVPADAVIGSVDTGSNMPQVAGTFC
jgi:hypothetical protein